MDELQTKPRHGVLPRNVNRFMPNYVFNAWKEAGGHIYLKLYAASTFVSDGVTIEEKTDYPFGDDVTLHIRADRQFALHFRLPRHCLRYAITKNGKTLPVSVENGFAVCRVEGDCTLKIAFSFSVEKHIEKTLCGFG